jgi:UrcA family protein
MKKILILAAAALTLSASPAFAQSAAAPAQVVVSYADLDLSTQRGARALDRRLRTAVQLACGPTSDADPAGKNDVLECRAETLAEARAQRDIAIASASGRGEIQIAARR